MQKCSFTRFFLSSLSSRVTPKRVPTKPGGEISFLFSDCSRRNKRPAALTSCSTVNTWRSDGEFSRGLFVDTPDTVERKIGRPICCTKLQDETQKRAKDVLGPRGKKLCGTSRGVVGQRANIEGSPRSREGKLLSTACFHLEVGAGGSLLRHGPLAGTCPRGRLHRGRMTCPRPSPALPLFVGLYGKKVPPPHSSLFLQPSYFIYLVIFLPVGSFLNWCG